jgi:ankyrin repeat protein
MQVSGDQARLVQLLADGVDVNEPSLQGDTALALAMEHGHTELAQMLLDNGADFEQMPTSMWSCAQVVDWFDRAFKWSDRYRVAMETAQIDGEALLAMDEAVLRDDIGVYLASHQ